MASISYRDDRKKWQVSYQDPDGKQKRQLFDRKKEAERFLEDVIVLKKNGGLKTLSVSNDVTFEQFSVQYLEWAEMNKRRKTFLNERYLLQANLLPFFGKHRFSEINPYLIERYKQKRQREGMSNRTVNVELTLLSVIFKRAMDWEYAVENPMRKVNRLRLAKRPPRFLAEDEVERMLAASKETYLYSLVLCAVSTGMPKSELFYLTWQDIDFTANTITVQSREANETLDAFTTKNYDFRTLEITPRLREILLAEYENRRSEYVFTYDGKPLRWSCDKMFRKICHQAGIENCTLHTLRHTFASHLAMQRVPLTHIQQLMGYGDYTTTLIYAHLSTESHKGQVHKLLFGTHRKDAYPASFSFVEFGNLSFSTKLCLSEIRHKKKNAENPRHC